jgi:hypothetical protein
MDSVRNHAHLPKNKRTFITAPAPAEEKTYRINTIVPDNKSRNIPEVVFVRRWAVGVLGIWREGVGWERGRSRWVSLSPTWV